jgi:molybdopterin-binding protein
MPAAGADNCGQIVTTYRMSEAAGLLGVSDDTLRRWADAGRLATSADREGRRVVAGSELARLAVELGDHDPSAGLSGTRSARNRFPGIVTRVEVDGLVALVEIQAGPARIVSLMTSEAARELDLQPGDRAVGIVKSTQVVIEAP